MPAAAIVGGAVVSGAASLIGSNKAAGAAEDASRRSVAETQRQFDLVRGDTAYARQVGQGALGKLSQLYGLGGPSAAPAQPQPGTAWGGRVGIPERGGFGNIFSRTPQAGGPAAAPGAAPPAGPDMSVFWQSPDYQFNLAEGQKAIDNSLVSRGGALSGAGVKAGVRYASGMASREFGSFYDRLASLAGIGQTGVAQSAAAGANAAGNISQAYLTAGAQRGSAYLTGAEGVNNAAQGGISNFLLRRYLTPAGVHGSA